MAYVTDCDYCGQIAMCENDEAGGTACQSCLASVFGEAPPEPEIPSDNDLEAQYEHMMGYADIQCEEYYNDSMDGDHESGFTSIGWGLDESYGGYDYDDYGDF